MIGKGLSKQSRVDSIPRPWALITWPTIRPPPFSASRVITIILGPARGTAPAPRLRLKALLVWFSSKSICPMPLRLSGLSSGRKLPVSLLTHKKRVGDYLIRPETTLCCCIHSYLSTPNAAAVSNNCAHVFSSMGMPDTSRSADLIRSGSPGRRTPSLPGAGVASVT